MTPSLSTWLASIALATAGSVCAQTAPNLLLNGTFSAGTTGWKGFTLSDGSPLLNLYVNPQGELELLGRWDRCSIGDPPSCHQLPAAPMLSQSVTLRAGTYRISWRQRNHAQGNWPTQGLDVWLIGPGESLYVRDPVTGYSVRRLPNRKAAIWVADPVTGGYGNAPDATYAFTYRVRAGQAGVYTLYVGLDNAGNSVDNANGSYLYDTIWADQFRLVRQVPRLDP